MTENKNNLVFYRKYRPRKFDEIVGQEGTVAILKNAILKDRISHAYLFSGPRGTGKTTIARIFAHDAGASDEDIIEIDAASSRGIDEARALREAVRILPLKSKYKVYIIDEAHMLTKEAFNALLKTLEEPPEHTIFILATTELQKVPDTIISRTQHFSFRKIPIPQIATELKKIALLEKIKIDDDALKLAAFFADGSLRDAENILFQASSLGERAVKEEDLRIFLGVPKEELVNKITADAISKNVAEMLSALDQALEEGADPPLIGRLILRNFRAIHFLTLDPKTESLILREFSSDEVVFLKKFSGAGKEHLMFAVYEILNALFAPADDATAHMPLELALIKIATYSK